MGREKCNLLHSNQMVLLVCNHPKYLPLCHLPNKYHLSNPLKHPPFHQPNNHPHSNHLAYKLLVLLKLSQEWEVLKTSNLREVRTEQVCLKSSRTLILLKMMDFVFRFWLSIMFKIVYINLM